MLRTLPLFFTRALRVLECQAFYTQGTQVLMQAHYGISASVKNCNGATIQIFRAGCQGARHAESSSKQHRKVVV
jgi:hypothetical protein